jgi:hypothetical protein
VSARMAGICEQSLRATGQHWCVLCRIQTIHPRGICHLNADNAACEWIVRHWPAVVVPGEQEERCEVKCGLPALHVSLM